MFHVFGKDDSKVGDKYKGPGLVKFNEDTPGALLIVELNRDKE